MNDDLGDRMKSYEAEYAPIVPRGLPVVVRLDGRAFSTWTRGLARPSDVRLEWAMQTSTAHLMEETGASIGYAQSDEITLVLYANGRAGKGRGEVFFNGKTQKLASVCASLLTACFAERAANNGLSGRGPAIFDARVFGVPTQREATMAVLWRVRDAVKNGITAVAMRHASHAVLDGMNQDGRLALIAAAGDAMENHSPHLRHGSLFVRRRLMRTFTPEEIDALPAKHEARRNPDLTFERSVVVPASVPDFLAGDADERDAVLWGPA